jgi:tetratricopeptide (TPR) repeat protein
MSNLRDVLGSMFDRESRADPSPTPQAAPSDPTPPFTAQDAPAWCREGRRLADLGRREEAIACYEQALGFDPRHAPAWHSKALCLAALGCLDDAINCYGRAVALDPQLAEAWFEKALCEDQTGRTRDAAHSYGCFIAVARAQDAPQIAYARRRLAESSQGRNGAPGAAASAKPAPSPAARDSPQASPMVAGGYKQGDRIGTFEVQSVLGRGGFGVVYLVRLPVPGDISALRTFRDEDLARRGRPSDQYITYALKTFRDELLADARFRRRFRREAQMLVALERHPYLVQADFVDEIAGRLYIAMEYIAPNAEGLNSLEGYLARRPPDVAQSLRWAIQCCYGMEYAYSKGLRCHRDLKPANILITQEGAVKIADFGLAGALDQTSLAGELHPRIVDGRVGLSSPTVSGAGFGTPTHMPPEQFSNAEACDERSDVYAFGVVLYQMAAKGRLPFLPRLPRDPSPAEVAQFLREAEQLHREAPVPRLDSPLFPIIERCLAKRPGGRYQSFSKLREDLDSLLWRETGETLEPPALCQLTGGEWHIKGYSLNTLGRWEEAILCYDRAIALEPRGFASWSNKGSCLGDLGRWGEALACYDQALAIAPWDSNTWNSKGTCLTRMGRPEEALACFDRALDLVPDFADAWNNKGSGLEALGRGEEALACADRALSLDPLNAVRWYSKGTHLEHLGRAEEALACADRALALNPLYGPAWSLKAHNLAVLGHHQEAIDCWDRALAGDPQLIVAWINKGVSLAALGYREEAIACYDRALAIDPREAMAWNNKGNNLAVLGRIGDAMTCYNKAVALDPGYVNAWFNKATAEEQAGRPRDAASSYERFLNVAPAGDVVRIQRARLRLRELKGWPLSLVRRLQTWGFLADLAAIIYLAGGAE